jgi:FixJ family two-component response regulator
MTDAQLYARLSKKQKLCLEGVCKGLPVKAIAAALRISPKTVDFHLRRVREKIPGLHCIADMVRFAIRAGALKP